jgi:hypothetical protein
MVVLALMGCDYDYDDQYVSDSGSSWSSAKQLFRSINSPQRKDVIRLIYASDCHITWLVIYHKTEVVVAMPVLDIAKNSKGFKRAGNTAMRKCK